MCPETMVVDLSGGLVSVWNRMDHRTKYSVRLAERRGTEVHRFCTLDSGAVPLSALQRFQTLYDETSGRHNLPWQPAFRFRELFQLAREHSLHLDLYIAGSGEGTKADAAAAIVARNGSEAWYLFAASSAARREAAGPSAILYRALADCAETGIMRMDLLGVGPKGDVDHPLSGLTRFKKGFGGRCMQRAGAWDYVLQPDRYTRET